MTAIPIRTGTARWPFDLGVDDTAWSIAVPPITLPDTAAADADWTIDGTINPVSNGETVGSNGAAAMGVPAAISTYHVDGTGIRIGILSDSFDLLGGEATDIAHGLLPADGVTILQEGPDGSEDEGRAMAELIHAVAPGAQLYFYSGSLGEYSFAAGIIALAQQGCSVIVDDLTYYDEPFFQDGSPVQTAVEDVVAEGVSYFTSASNAGDSFYQATFAATVITLPGSTGPVVADQFGNGTAFQSLTIAGNEPIVIDLQWDQPFASIGTLGASSQNSLALYLLNSDDSAVVASATVDLVGNNPDQVLQFTNPGATADYNLAIVWTDGTVQPGLFKYIIYSGYAGADTINDADAGKGSGSVIGHELVPAANTVGAVNSADTPPPLEPYSSVGPGTILFDANGNLLATPINPQKVNFVAPDDIATSVFNPFNGTSAAAPNAAAVAALMLQANPNLTPAQVTAALAATASPMSNGATADGAGLVQAGGAVQASFGVVWRAAAGGNWSTGLGWVGGSAPTTLEPATLSDDFGTLDTNYTVTVNAHGAAAQTLTVGDTSALTVTLKVAAGMGLTVSTGATVGQHGTLSVAGSGTLAVGGIAELIDPTAVLTLQAAAAMTAQVFEVGAGTVTLGAGAAVVATGSINLTLTFGSVAVPVPFGFAMGGGSVTVGTGAVIATNSAGGVFLGGGGLTINAGGTLADLNGGSTSMIVLDTTVIDRGSLGVAGELLVNNGAAVSVAAHGRLSAAGIDVEGTDATLTIAGTVTDSGALTGADDGTVDIVAGGTLVIDGAMSGANIELASGGRLVLAALDAATLTTGLTSVIAFAGVGVAEIDLPGVAYNHGTDTLHLANGALAVSSGATRLAGLAFPATAHIHLPPADDGSGGLLIGVACYCRGTKIATPAGEVPIEALRIGDLVLIAGGGARPIRWIGRRSYGRGHVSTHRHVQPIRIRAGALGADAGGPVPRRDLRVSPEHALLLEDTTGAILVPAHLLVNGASIVRETERAGVDYVHLELREHDAILAEGAAAETFVDCESRALFDNAAEFVALYPDEAAQRGRPGAAPHFCAPRVEAGPALVRVLRRLHAFAGIVHGPLGGPTSGPAGGHLDRADRELVVGWAHDHANPDCPVLLEIVVNGVVLGTTLADRYRADMAALKLAGGHCAFRFQFPKPLDPDRRHIVAVRRAADGADLRASPVLIDRVERPASMLNDLRSAPPELRREVAAYLKGEIQRLSGRALTSGPG